MDADGKQDHEFTDSDLGTNATTEKFARHRVTKVERQGANAELVRVIEGCGGERSELAIAHALPESADVDGRDAGQHHREGQADSHQRTAARATGRDHQTDAEGDEQG